LPPGIEVVLEVTHGELAQAAIHRLARAQTGVIGFSDRAPESADAVDGHDMVGIANSLEIDDEGRVADQAQRGGAKQRAFQAVAGTMPQDEPWRIAGVSSRLEVVVEIVEKTLDLERRRQAAQGTLLRRREICKHCQTE